ncbi:hypothetical protein ACFX11_003079 [Malus domestica]
MILRKQFYPILTKVWANCPKYVTEFNNQAMVLDVDVDDYDVFMKYTRGLADYLWKKLKLFIVETIEEAIIKAITIKEKNKQNPSSKSDLKKKGKKVKQNVVQAIIDPGSQKNLISEALVQKVGLYTKPYPKPYLLGWI